MNLNDTLDILEYCIKCYHKSNEGRNFTILDYYAITNISPKYLAIKAYQADRKNTANTLRFFGNCYDLSSSKMTLKEALDTSLVINNQSLNDETKKLIYNTLVSEGYPLKSGIYIQACRRFVKGGLNSILKENICNHLMENYKLGVGIPNVQKIKKL